MSKRSYRDDSFTESEKTNANGNGSRDSGRVLRKSELDNIASEEGFVFFKKLGLGNSLYSNKEGTLKRVYDKYGKVVSTYNPKSCLQSTIEFHHPISCLPAVLSNFGFRQYTGNGKKSGQ